MSDTLFIRADMNSEISTGHVMRCLSVADAAKRMGKKAVFIAADDQPKELIESRGHECIVLGTAWNNLESEIPALGKVIGSEKIERLFIDHYSVTENYLKAVNELTEVIYLDDLKAFDYPVSGIVCYAVYGEDYYPDKDPEKKYFLGCGYAPLREAFENPHPKNIKEKPESILIMTGGSDPFGIAEGVLGAIPLDDYRSVNVICGRFSGKKEKLRSFIIRHMPDKNHKYERHLSSVCAWSRYEKSKTVCVICEEEPPFEKQLMDREDVENPILAPYEDAEFFIPRNADKYLTLQYGDYMQLPPESERVAHIPCNFVETEG